MISTERFGPGSVPSGKQLDRQQVLTLPQLVLRNSIVHSDRTAMRFKRFGIWREYTWSEVYNLVEQLAAGLLRTIPDGYDRPIAIIGDNEPEFFLAEYAVQCLDTPVVCLYPDLSSDEVEKLLRASAVTVVFAEDQEQCDKLEAIANNCELTNIVYWDERGLEDYEPVLFRDFLDIVEVGKKALAEQPELIRRGLESASPESDAILVYTSGTTGKPKGTKGNHRYLIDCAWRWQEVLGARPNRNYVSYISPAWATEQYLGLTLCAMLPMVTNFPEEPETMARDFREIGANYVFYSPRQWEMLASDVEVRIEDASKSVQLVYRICMAWLKEGRVTRPQKAGGLVFIKRAFADLVMGSRLRDRMGLTYVEAGVNSGGSLSPEVFEFFTALGISIRNVYGFTEVGIVTGTHGEARFETVGTVLQSPLASEPLDVRIQDGEIQVRPGVVFSGYKGLPELTASRFTEDGWIRSDDAGFIDSDGYLTYMDRLEDIIPLPTGAGFSPQFVEMRLRARPYIRDSLTWVTEWGGIGALIDIDEAAVGRFAEREDLTFTNHSDLTQLKDVVALVGEQIAVVNSKIPEWSQIDAYAVLYKPLDADEGELTRTRKLRRDVVLSKSSDIVRAIDDRQTTVDAATDVSYRDGLSARVRATVRLTYLAGSLISTDIGDSGYTSAGGN